ncbi:MAG TPA: hypothetical protein VMW25_04390 [Clostridia bacterium]|nr:hypothetical protein [Clostridia bacterium]
MKKIKHLRITVGEEDCYICNQACCITLEKCTWKKEEVTCKNCLKQLAKHPTYMQKRKYKIVKESGRG